MSPMPSEVLSTVEVARELKRLRQINPLIHCLTNEVVQEITANVLLASGASPAMVVAQDEVESFASIASAILVNLGTPYESRLNAMRLAVKVANRAGIPWVLDPVAAGVMPWRNTIIQEFVSLKPTVIRGNASEILYLAGVGQGGKGVDSIDSSQVALEPAIQLAQKTGCIVAVTGKVDYITDGKRTLEAHGGHPLITKVVGTGCSLSALVAAFLVKAPDPLIAVASCCAFVNKASELATAQSAGPGSFHTHYLDMLYRLKPEDFAL